MMYVVRFFPRRWLLYSIYVDPQHRKEGHFKAIMSDALERAKAEGVEELKLVVFHKNALAIELFGKLGFETTN